MISILLVIAAGIAKKAIAFIVASIVIRAVFMARLFLSSRYHRWHRLCTLAATDSINFAGKRLGKLRTLCNKAYKRILNR
jgi:hypothetical protein